MPKNIFISFGGIITICILFNRLNRNTAPLSPQTRLREIKKRVAAAVLGLYYGVGANEKVQNTGEPMPNCFLSVDF